MRILQNILLLTVLSPLFLTTHFNIATSSTTVDTFLGYISSKKGLSLFIPKDGRMKRKVRSAKDKRKVHNFLVEAISTGTENRKKLYKSF